MKVEDFTEADMNRLFNGMTLARGAYALLVKRVAELERRIVVAINENDALIEENLRLTDMLEVRTGVVDGFVSMVLDVDRRLVPLPDLISYAKELAR